jgi:ATP-binding cassette subfamily C exporter for protease/lipase
MIKPPQQRPELELALLSFRRAFLTIGAFSFFINLLMLTPSIYMLQIYDRALGSRNVTTLLMLTLITLGLFALMSVLERIRSMVLVRVGARLDLDVNARVFDATFERNLRQAGQNPAQALNDLSTMRQTLTGAGLIALADAPWMPIYLIVIFMMHTHLGLFSLIGVLVLVALAIINERVSAAPLGEAQRLAMAANAQANNHLRNAEVIEAMGMLPAIRSRWFKLHEKFLMQQAFGERSCRHAQRIDPLRTHLDAIAGAGLWRAAGHRRRNYLGNDDCRLDPCWSCSGSCRGVDCQLEAVGIGTRRLPAPD